MKIIENQTFDQERALYGVRNVKTVNCRFDGPADGESAFKECANIAAENCFLNLRYPFWHDRGLEVKGCELTENCRAALWYSRRIRLEDTRLHGIKALRECADVELKGCDIRSPEFGWSSKKVTMEDCTAESEYFMMRASGLRFQNVTFTGKYSFQYIRDAVLENCRLTTKDAFWHARNVVVKNSVVEGEYLGWYSRNLTFENCVIRGTQPLCYCKGLKLVNCRMEHTDLAFEKSEVQATVTTPIDSVKNPKAGRIEAPAVGKVIRDDPAAKGEVVCTGHPAGRCA